MIVPDGSAALLGLHDWLMADSGANTVEEEEATAVLASFLDDRGRAFNEGFTDGWDNAIAHVLAEVNRRIAKGRG